ncbi:MAG: DNA polymerase III subunit delta' [Bacteroidetes bacterium]|nr:DNA polymerase III subunit delta' [Bacteroidota bacterium]
MWPTVIGQRRVKQVLLSALRNSRLAHAYLFYGNEGVGKDAMAIELARMIHCEQGGEEPCGTCASCSRMATLQHPDVRLVLPLPVGKGEQSDDDPLAKLSESEVRTVQEELRQKGANPYYRISIPRANIIKITSIREVRRESVMSTFDGRKRIFIITRADAMGAEASNTLLKTLEEPSGDCLLILTTSRPDVLLQTIRSRCQSVRFDPLTEEEISAALVERDGVDHEPAELVARLSSGSYTKAVELLHEHALEERKHVIAFVRHSLGSNTLLVCQDIDRITEPRDRERVERFLVLLLMWFRDAMVLPRGGSIVNEDQRESLERFVAKFPDANLFRLLSDIEHAISLVRRNVYIKLVFYQLSVLLKRNILSAQ